MNEDRQKYTPPLPISPDSTSSTGTPEVSSLIASSSPMSPGSTSPATSAISAPVDKLLHRIRDIEVASQTIIPLAVKQKTDELSADAAELRQLAADMESEPQHARGSLSATALNKVFGVLKKMVRSSQSDIADTLARSLFIGAFSIFDAFIGDLFAVILAAKPCMLKSGSGTALISDVLSAASLDDFKKSLIIKEVERLRRESYPDQFDRLEKLFEITLTRFEHWPAFVEAAQRRNLITHSDGIVSEQYIQVCRKHLVPNEGIAAGSQLDIKQQYLMDSCALLREVAAKLTHTLWRKIFQEEREIADRHLNDILYDALHLEEWNWTILMGDFALSQHKFAKEIYKRMMVVNLAQAWHHKGNPDKARAILLDFDWTAVGPEFSLAHAVLTDDFTRAASIMKSIGKETEMIKNVSYHHWPLFRDFRTSPEFLEAYESVYGYAFARKVRDAAGIAEKEATASANPPSEDGPSSE